MAKAYPLEPDRAAEHFGLSSEQCELLLAFETAPSLEALARALSRDASVLSRQLQRIAQDTPALEKTHGRWRLTPLGKQLAAWTRDAIVSQRRALSQPTVLRLASTREFAARVLAPRLGQLFQADPTTSFSLFAFEDGVERHLLSGEADIGFDCGRPTDPELRFRQVVPEPFAVVAAPSFVERHGVQTGPDLLPLENLQYQRATASTLLGLHDMVPNVRATFNDVASVREACSAALGWAVLPTYAVRRELDLGTLVALGGFEVPEEHFGVFWLRERPALEVWVERCVAWLGGVTLA
ncbi:MAG: substrate-binding domain-containing protein [Myxococcales bacterium]|nr:substrate-binding domain-containing protein [Myxococcales bacterium]